MQVAVFLAVFLVGNALAGTASLAAFVGEVVAVAAPVPAQTDVLKRFTMRIQYVDDGRGDAARRDHAVGETITFDVKPENGLCMIDGQLVNAATFAAALRPGMRGYVCGETWFDLHLTPDYRLGEILAYEDEILKLREYRRHRPPQEQAIEIRLANAPPTNRWVQLHKPGPATLSGFTSAAKAGPSINPLNCPANLLRLETEQPDPVLETRATVGVDRWINGAWEEVDLVCTTTTFVLDGKPVPASVGFGTNRLAVLGHFPNEATPHNIFVQSNILSKRIGPRDVIIALKQEREERGILVKAEEILSVRLNRRTVVRLEPDTRIFLNGQPAKARDLKQAKMILYHPARKKRTMVILPE